MAGAQADGGRQKSCCTPHLARPSHATADDLDCAKSANKDWLGRTVLIPGGDTHIGTDKAMIPQDAEAPRKQISLRPFRMDPHCVTNDWFAEFVAETGYKTEAERFGWSLVFWSFTDPNGSYMRVRGTPWWCKVEGASWCRPFGPKSHLDGYEDHPVVHVSWNDARAFAAWAGGRLPTEAQWEHAARGGNSDAIYPWGNQEPTDSAPLCNIWQGRFPHEDKGIDGYRGTAPVTAFASNAYGLHQMSGNVWEWSRDPYLRTDITETPRPGNATEPMLLKGGSFLCHKSYCYRYRIAARTGANPDSSTSHLGFRLVV